MFVKQRLSSEFFMWKKSKCGSQEDSLSYTRVSSPNYANPTSIPNSVCILCSFGSMSQRRNVKGMNILHLQDSEREIDESHQHRCFKRWDAGRAGRSLGAACPIADIPLWLPNRPHQHQLCLTYVSPFPHIPYIMQLLLMSPCTQALGPYHTLGRQLAPLLYPTDFPR